MINCYSTLNNSKLNVSPVPNKLSLSFLTEHHGRICVFLYTHAYIKRMQKNIIKRWRNVYR